MTDQSRTCADKMSGQKRAACSPASLDEGPPMKKHGITVKKIDKWITKSDKEISTSAWLKYEKADRDYAATLSIEFNEKLRGMRNYNPAFIVGSKNLRASSY